MIYKDLAHTKVLMARNIEHLVSTNAFSILVSTSDAEQRKQIESYINNSNFKELKTLVIDSVRDIKPLKSLSLRTLRRVASGLGIPYYTQKVSAVLIDEIQAKQGGNHARASRKGRRSQDQY